MSSDYEYEPDEEYEKEDEDEGNSGLGTLLGLASYVVPQNKNSDVLFRLMDKGIGLFEKAKKAKVEKRERKQKAKIEIAKALQQIAESKQRLATQKEKDKLDIAEKRLKIELLRKQLVTPVQQHSQQQEQSHILYGELPSVPYTPALECPDNPDEFKAFLDYITHNPTSILILGSKGQGKSALGHALLEYIHAISGKPAVILGAPKEKARLFPNWIRIVEDWNEVPEGSIVLVDEAGIILFSRNSMSKVNKSFAEINAISRQKSLTLIYTSQSSRSIDVNSIYAGEIQIIFKKPHGLSMDYERSEIKKLAKDALSLLLSHVEDKTKLKEYSVLYFFSGEGKFLMRNGLASYWSEDLSRLFSGVSMKSKDQEIRKLYMQGLTQQAIAQSLGVTQGYVSRVLSEK